MEYRCNKCNKDYSSYQSLWIHNKKFHTIVSSKLPQTPSLLPQKSSNIPEIIICSFCNKQFSRKDNLKRHEKSCKNKINTDDKYEILEKKISELKAELDKTKNITSITNNNNNNSNNNINNGTIINNVVKFGDLSYDAIFNDKQIRNILKHKHKALEESIIQTHFNDNLPKLKNIFITNLRDNLAHIFDGQDMTAVSKADAINELIEIHSAELAIALEKYRDKISKTDADKVEEMLNDLTSDQKFFDENENKVYPNRSAYKGEKIKILVYNKSDLDQFKKLINGINKRFNLEIDVTTSEEL